MLRGKIFSVGFGSLIPAITFLSFVIFLILMRELQGPDFVKENPRSWCIPFITSSPIVWLLGRWLNGKDILLGKPPKGPPKFDIDRHNSITGYHSFLFIPFEWWAFVFVVIGIGIDLG